MMKCSVCGYPIGDGDKSCKGCGRVISKADRENAARKENPFTFTDEDFDFPKGKKTVYRPAGAPAEKDKLPNINDIFSSDPNAPEYNDPESYDKATADVINYYREYVKPKKKAQPEYGVDDEDIKIFSEPPKKSARRYEEDTVFIENPYDADGDYTENYSEDGEEFDSQPERPVENRRKKANKPAKINPKRLVVICAVLIGLIIIVTGVYQIGRSLNFWGGDTVKEQNTGSDSQMLEPNGTAEKTTASDSPDSAASAKTGKYTVSSSESYILMHKSETDNTIFASIPNKTVVNVEKISGDRGRVTYNGRTGWVMLSELKYTPDAKDGGGSESTTAAKEDSTGEKTPEYKPGSYTVDTKGSKAVNVRDDHSPNGDILTTLPDGTSVEVTEIKSGWGHIKTDDIDGWIYMEYLK